MHTFTRGFQKEINKVVLSLLLIGDWNDECKGKFKKKLCKEFGLVNIYHENSQNHEKLKTYQEGEQSLTIDKIEPLTYEPIKYIKVRGGNRG